MTDYKIGDYAVRTSIHGWAVFQLCEKKATNPFDGNTDWKQTSKWYARLGDASRFLRKLTKNRCAA